MLTGANVIPADPARFHTPHWVVFVAGLAFLTVGIMTLQAKHRATYPARYLFATGILMTSLFLVAVAVSMYTSGSVIAIGPVLIKGAVGDDISRAMYGVSAMIVGMLAFVAWRAWFQALKSPSPSLQDRPAAGGPPSAEL